MIDPTIPWRAVPDPSPVDDSQTRRCLEAVRSNIIWIQNNWPKIPKPKSSTVINQTIVEDETEYRGKDSIERTNYAFMLRGDKDKPGANKAYSTDSNGVKGWFEISGKYNFKVDYDTTPGSIRVYGGKWTRCSPPDVDILGVAPNNIIFATLTGAGADYAAGYVVLPVSDGLRFVYLTFNSALPPACTLTATVSATGDYGETGGSTSRILLAVVTAASGKITQIKQMRWQGDYTDYYLTPDGRSLEWTKGRTVEGEVTPHTAQFKGWEGAATKGAPVSADLIVIKDTATKAANYVSYSDLKSDILSSGGGVQHTDDGVHTYHAIGGGLTITDNGAGIQIGTAKFTINWSSGLSITHSLVGEIITKQAVADGGSGSSASGTVNVYADTMPEHKDLTATDGGALVKTKYESNGDHDYHVWPQGANYTYCAGQSIGVTSGTHSLAGQVLRIDLVNERLYLDNNAAHYSLDWSVRTLLDSSWATTLNWGARTLTGGLWHVNSLGKEGGTYTLLDLANQKILDDGGNEIAKWTSADFTVEKLLKVSDTTAASSTSALSGSVQVSGGLSTGARSCLTGGVFVHDAFGVGESQIVQLCVTGKADVSAAGDIAAGDGTSGKKFVCNGNNGVTVTNWTTGGIVTGTLTEISAADLKPTDKILVRR